MRGRNYLERYEIMKRATFHASNPTPLTGIASADAPTAFSATAGLMSVYNGASITNNQRSVVIPKRLKLLATAANTSATALHLIGYLDSIERHSSGGPSITPVNLFKTSDSSYTDVATRAKVDFGELTFAAASDAKLVFHIQISEAVLAAEEQLEVLFVDSLDDAVLPSLANNQMIVQAPVIGPGCTLTIHEVAPSQAADPAFEFEFDYVEYGLDL